MKRTSLGELFKISSGGTPSRNNKAYYENGTIPWIKTGNLGEKYVSGTIEKITKFALNNSSAKIFPANTVLVAMYGATIGSCSILNFEAATNQACAAFLPSSKVSHEFLYYFLKQYKTKLVSLGQGGGQPNISATILKRIEIPLPPLDDQTRIAHLLGKVEGLIARRKQHLQQLDDLLKSVFLDMFGDPVRNEKKHNISTLAPYITHLTSGGRGWATYYSDSGKRFIRSLDVQMNAIGSDDVVYVTPPNNKETERTRVIPGDVLLTITGSKIGRVCFVPQGFEEAYISQHVAIIRTKGINPVYLSFYLSMPACGQRIIAKQQYGQAKPGLNLTQIQNFEIIDPDLDLQNQFAAIVEKVESLKSRYQHSLTDLETLYGALSQKAFKGELDLSRVPLSVKEFEQAIIEDVKTKIETDIEENHQRAPLSKLVALTFVEGRKALLDQLLPTWLDQLGDTPFSAQHFMTHVEQRAADLIEAQDSDARFVEHEDVQFGSVEYDHLKTRVFEAIEQGRLTQGYDDANNRVQVIAAKK